MAKKSDWIFKKFKTAIFPSPAGPIIHLTMKPEYVRFYDNDLKDQIRFIMCDTDEKNSPKEIIRRTYTNGEITVVWEAHKCTHSGNCVKSNRDVFKPKERPWVKPLNSTTDKIIEAVDKCPSGALTYFYNESEKNTGL